MTYLTIHIWLIPIASFCVGLTAIFLISKSKIARQVMDIPNHRSLHSSPKPRIGGLGIAASLLLITTLLLWIYPEQRSFRTGWLLPLIATYAGLLLISWRDDMASLTATQRLIAHLVLCAAWAIVCLPGLLAFYGLSLSTTLIVLAIITLGLGWAMNLFNFMDGSDGIAGAMAMIGFLAYAIASYLSNDVALGVFCLSMASACAAFLCFNWPPAKLFMGDSGSIPLGFMLAAIGTLGVIKQYWSPLFPLIVHTLFWVDATVTLANRASHGKKLSESHREHIYQKAIQAGISHQKLLQIHLACNILFSAIAIAPIANQALNTAAFHFFTIASITSVVVALGYIVKRRFSQHTLQQSL